MIRRESCFPVRELSLREENKRPHWPFWKQENDSRSLRRAVTISITAGKGGVGKTSVAAKMALELSLMGKKVLLIDCDYNLSNTLIKLGIPQDEKFFQYLSMEKSFEDCLYRLGDLHIFSGCNGSLFLIDKTIEMDKIIIPIIKENEKKYDYILLDSPPGLSRDILRLNAFCDQRLFIITPDRSSLTDSYSLIKVLNKKYGVNENHLLANRVLTDEQYRKLVSTISETAESFLGCRTFIVGGIRDYKFSHSNFDEVLFKDRSSRIHKNFIKIIYRYAESNSRTMSI